MMQSLSQAGSMPLALLRARRRAAAGLTLAQAEQARQITYAYAARSGMGRTFIRATENATGRIGVLRRLAGSVEQIERGGDFWRVMSDCFGLRLEVIAGSLEKIPQEGPLVVVANHPFGVADGLALGQILAGARGREFRIVANEIFARGPLLERIILPVDFSETPGAQRTNLSTRARALEHLDAGGAVGVFPGGTVSTGAHPFAPAMDPLWRAFTARMVARSGATVVPVWFEGANSRLFQMASHLNFNLRIALMLHEFHRRMDRPVRLAIGAPIPPGELAGMAGNGKEMMDFLRRRTYALSPKPLDTGRLGHEFEARYRR